MMDKNNNFFKFIVNVLYSLGANGISLILSATTALVLPKLLHVETYGYYQMYIFYLSYVPFFQLGWTDGIPLRYGGIKYSELNKSLFISQFWSVAVIDTLFSVIIIFLNFKIPLTINEHMVILCVCLAAIVMCPRWVLIGTMHATGKIKEYAIVILCERVLSVIGIIIALFQGYKGFFILLVIDIIAKLISLILGIMYCRDIVFGKFASLKDSYFEAKRNLSAGVKIMIANLAGILIVGVVRIGIQKRWDISTFSKVSLTINLSNMVLQLISSISTVMISTLRRETKEMLPIIYNVTRTMLIIVIYGGLIFFYPLNRILVRWLPKYSESLHYAAILFPMCVYEAKMSLLINPYCKTLRKEKSLLIINIASLSFSIISTLITVFILKNLTLAIVTILLSLVFRSTIGELYLSRFISISNKLNMILEFILTISFIICNWFFGWEGMVLYFLVYVLFLLIKKTEIIKMLTYVRSVL